MLSRLASVWRKQMQEFVTRFTDTCGSHPPSWSQAMQWPLAIPWETTSPPFPASRGKNVERPERPHDLRPRHDLRLFWRFFWRFQIFQIFQIRQEMSKYVEMSGIWIRHIVLLQIFWDGIVSRQSFGPWDEAVRGTALGSIGSISLRHNHLPILTMCKALQGKVSYCKSSQGPVWGWNIWFHLRSTATLVVVNFSWIQIKHERRNVNWAEVAKRSKRSRAI